MSSNNSRVQTIAMGGVVLTVLLIVGAFTVSIARGESFGDSLPVLLAFVTPTDPYFRGNWVFATAFLYSDGSGWVRADLPVENSNRTTLAP